MRVGSNNGRILRLFLFPITFEFIGQCWQDQLFFARKSWEMKAASNRE
ncbi:hypothetical protein [Azospirillum melinis]